jgi:hypothetical protein
MVMNLSKDNKEIENPSASWKTPLKKDPSNCARCQPNESVLLALFFSDIYKRDQ